MWVFLWIYKEGIMIINHKTTSMEFCIGITTFESDNWNYLNYPAGGYGDNLCSNAYDNDRELGAMVNMEAWNMFGVELTFYKATYDANYDRIWGEDGDRIVTNSWNVMSYFQLPKENKIWSKFGIEGVNDFSMYISKLHFKGETDNYIPKIGDLVLSIYNNKLYEITEVKEEAPMFMLSKQYAWELIVRKAKIEHDISISPSLSASPISSFYSVSDIFTIKDDIDIEKEDIIYKPIQGEKPKDDPFGNW
jgi:hypothetical protein